MVIKLAEPAFRAVVEDAPDAIVLVDRDGRIAYVNTRTEELFGYDRSELNGQRVEFLVPVELRAMHTIHREIYQERPERRPMGAGLELVGQRKDGSTFPVEISLSPSRDVDTPLTVAVVRDVSRQRRAEEALRRSEARHRLLNERAESVIFRYRLSPSPGFEYVSAAVSRSLGHAPEEFYVDPEFMFELAHPDDREALRRTFGGETPGAILRFVSRDRGVRWFEVNATAVHGSDGATVALEGSARDVTERLIADEERLHLEAEIEMQSERNRLAGDLHDDTLQSIYALGLGLHAMRDDDSFSREDIVDRAVDGLNQVIATLRSYMQRLRGSDLSVDVDEPLATRIAALIGEEGPTEWSVDLEPGLELDPATERQLYLLAKELVSNVQRHAQAQSAQLSLRHDDTGSLQLEVVDDGVGFERGQTGAGSFGLRSIALRADAVGGDLSMETAPGEGTRVQVCIPQAALARNAPGDGKRRDGA